MDSLRAALSPGRRRLLLLVLALRPAPSLGRARRLQGGNSSGLQDMAPWVVGKPASCEGKEVRYTACHQLPCQQDDCVPRNCQVGAWSDWSDGDCTGLCLRQRGIARPNNHCGTPCNVSLIETMRCQTSCKQEVPCPKGTDCEWDDWTEWSACTCSCGGGQKTRDRQIKKAPQGNGQKCPARVKSEMVPCNSQPCGIEQCVDGAWGDWSAWGPCSAACGGGLQWRTRKVLVEASECGKPVTGDDRQLKYCNPQGCSGDVDCVFGQWTEWGPCSCSCDGVRRRSRRIEVYGKGNGKWCNGHTKEVAPCNDTPPVPLLEGTPVEGAQPGRGACAVAEDLVDCQFGIWSDWGTCSVTCGYGQHSRKRAIVREPKNFGLACKGPLEESARCDMAACDNAVSQDVKPCIWGVWQDWGSCDKCGGQRKRFRLILQMPEDGGAPCMPEASEETGECPRQCHSTFCTWGDWSVGACSVTCGVGTARYERQLVASATPPDPVSLFEASELPAPSSPLHVSESLVLGLAGGCLLTLLAQWSWQRGAPLPWERPRRPVRQVWSEEEIPLFRGDWMPVDGSDIEDAN